MGLASPLTFRIFHAILSWISCRWTSCCARIWIVCSARTWRAFARCTWRSSSCWVILSCRSWWNEFRWRNPRLVRVCRLTWRSRTTYMSSTSDNPNITTISKTRSCCWHEEIRYLLDWTVTERVKHVLRACCLIRISFNLFWKTHWRI